MNLDPSFTELDGYLFHEGTNYEIYRKLGAHPAEYDGIKGVHFAVWAPHAKAVSVLSDGNGWTVGADPMIGTEQGVWHAFIPGMPEGSLYQYAVEGADGVVRRKADPVAFSGEYRPGHASRVSFLDAYRWHDEEWEAARNNTDVWEKPMAVYEVHLGSWKKDWSRGEDGYLDYRTLADQLVKYVVYMGYTHVELMGICEHPFDGSWGYQVTGFFSPTSRYGMPDDFRYLVDVMHRNGIGVILDWVPAHFPKDAFGLENFDGTPLYESADPLRAEYPQWGTKAFDHGKPEVRSFLISSAFYWVKEFHIDALRVDAVAAMLYADFGREQWRPNEYGGHENLESIGFLRELNHAMKTRTSAYIIAEDSSIISGITTDPEYGGLGFTLKWNMGWMNAVLRYIGKDPIYRKYHHDLLTHSIDYTFDENYILPLSHDEVVHLKHSMLEKFPGGLPDRFGGLKTLYTYMFTHPGKKLLFMGQDFGDYEEWSEARQINWHLADDMWHRDIMDCIRRLLEIYKKYPVLYTDPRNHVSFEWINKNDAWRNTISYLRRNPWDYNSSLLVVCNFAPVQYENYTVGVPEPGDYRRIFSSYDSMPGGGGPGELGAEPVLTAEQRGCDGYAYTLTYSLRPYESIIFEVPNEPEKKSKDREKQKPKDPKAKVIAKTKK